MSKEFPLVSIIVPVYNKKIEHLKKCFNSLVEQTYDNIEIIIVDDGSSPDVAEFCKKYSLEKKCCYYRNEHNGVSFARNYGIRKSHGDYVMFVDSDDWLDKDCCSYFFEKGIGSKFDLIAFSYVKEYRGRRELVRPDGSLYEMSVIGSACMKFYRAAMLKGMGFNEELENAEDVEFNFRVFKNVKKYKYELKYFYHYRIMGESAVRKFDKDAISKYENTIKAIEKDIDANDYDQFVAYVNFLGIAYLVLLLNYVYTQEKDIDKNEAKIELRKSKFVRTLFENTGKLSLPLSRKLLILLDKYHFSFLVSFALYLKHRRDS